MTKLGELSVEEPIDGADQDAAYLGQRLEQLAAQRDADPNDHRRRNGQPPSVCRHAGGCLGQGQGPRADQRLLPQGDSSARL